MPDPMENLVLLALEQFGIPFTKDVHVPGGRQLDFYLSTLDVYIEVKQFHTPRTSEQMAQVANVIVLQGRPAVEFFVSLLVSIALPAR